MTGHPGSQCPSFFLCACLWRRGVWGKDKKGQLMSKKCCRNIMPCVMSSAAAIMIRYYRQTTCLVLSCFFRLYCTAPSGRAFSGACRSRPTLYRAEHHIPMGRVLRSCALEPVSGRCAALTHVLPVLVGPKNSPKPPPLCRCLPQHLRMT